MFSKLNRGLIGIVLLAIMAMFVPTMLVGAQGVEINIDDWYTDYPGGMTVTQNGNNVSVVLNGLGGFNLSLDAGQGECMLSGSFNIDPKLTVNNNGKEVSYQYHPSAEGNFIPVGLQNGTVSVKFWHIPTHDPNDGDTRVSATISGTVSGCGGTDPEPTPEPTPGPAPITSSAKVNQGTFGCELANVWGLPVGWKGTQFGHNVLEVKDGPDGVELYFGPINRDGEWTNQTVEFQYGDGQLGRFTLEILIAADGLWSEIYCEPVEPTLPEGGCEGCPPAACLLAPGMFIWNATAQKYLGIRDNGLPAWYGSHDAAVKDGLSYAGSECSTCVQFLVTKNEVWFGPGSTVEDTARALALHVGDDLDNRYMATAKEVRRAWYLAGMPQEGGWYSY